MREALGEVWRRVRLTWVDERCVPRRALDSNRGTAHRNGFLREDDPPAVELALFEDGETPEAACERVAEGLGRELHAGLDVVLLGMGADGHVGSIYPDSDALKDETGAAVLGVDMPGKRSITMSLPLINTAERVVVAASGTKKAETVRAVLEDDESELPGACVDAFSTIFFLFRAFSGL
mgnify:CR=1 FL=1